MKILIRSIYKDFKYLKPTLWDTNLHYPLYFSTHLIGAYMHNFNFLTFSIYIFDTIWQNFMLFFQNLCSFGDGMLAKNLNFQVKILVNKIGFKSKALDFFAEIIIWTHNDSRNMMKKQNFIEFQNFCTLTKIKIFPDFPNFGQKFWQLLNYPFSISIHFLLIYLYKYIFLNLLHKA